MNEDTKKGLNVTLGAIYAFSLIFVVEQLISSFINPYLQDIDPTDQDRHTRSGLAYYKDFGTGKEYISSGCGSPLVERVK